MSRFQFDLPHSQPTADCLHELANVLCLFVDIFEAPGDTGNGDDFKLSFVGADGASIILTSIEQGLRELANDLDGKFRVRSDAEEDWRYSNVKYAAFNTLGRYLMQYLKDHIEVADDLVTFFHRVLQEDFADWDMLTPVVTGEQQTAPYANDVEGEED